MSAQKLGALAQKFFRANARSFGLDQRSLQVAYVLNWGGFVNYSYRVGDGRREYHLKLSTSLADQDALRRWKALSPMLERYHAPPILEWIDLGSAAGLLFPVVEGSPPDLDEAVVAEIAPVLMRLNADRELHEALRSPHPATAAALYLGTFHQRFTEDLRGIRDARPAFMTADLLKWLETEVASLAGLVETTAAFEEPLESPVHGDLWLNNILWTDRNHWHAIDWDDLRIGDPAADFATLLGPSARDPRPLKLVEQVTPLLSATQRERLTLLGRATLLDWVIDPVSDWIDADVAPLHAREVRAEKERVHRLSLGHYLETYD